MIVVTLQTRRYFENLGCWQSGHETLSSVALAVIGTGRQLNFDPDANPRGHQHQFFIAHNVRAY